MFATIVSQAIRFGIVFLYGSTGEIIIEKSGHLNLGIPGTMCIGAIGGCLGANFAYNAGSGNVDKWIQNGTIKEDGSDIENVPYKETNMYVRKILRDYKIYMELED